MNQNFTGFGSDYTVKSSDVLLSFRLQKINNTFIRYLVTKNSYEISTNSSLNIQIVPSGIRNPNLVSFSSSDDAFFYHNQIIFSARPTDSSNIIHYYIQLKSNISDNYLRILERSKYIHRVLGYYDENNDYLIIYYQFGNIITYFSVKNVSYFYYYESKSKTVEVKSNYSMTFNVSELITYPIEHELLHQTHICHYQSTTERNWQYNNGKISFDKNTQILNVSSYNNDWMALHYYYRGGGGSDLNDITIYFVFPRSIIYIRTCMFKCGSCSQDYNTCDYGSCKRNFAMLRDSSIDDNDCYPNDQNMPN